MSIYLGPFLRCTRPHHDVVTERRTCQNKKCTDFNKGNRPSLEQFCPRCGYVISVLSATEKKPASHGTDVMLRADRFLCPVNSLETQIYEYLIVERAQPEQPRRFCISDPIVIDRTGFDCNRELNWFTTAYATELQVARGFYPEVEVLWGLLHWYS